MDFDGQLALFEAAVEAGVMQVHWEHPHGWTVHIKARRQGESWGSTPAHFYSELSTEELLDVIVAVWAKLLGL